MLAKGFWWTYGRRSCQITLALRVSRYLKAPFLCELPNTEKSIRERARFGDWGRDWSKWPSLARNSSKSSRFLPLSSGLCRKGPAKSGDILEA